MDVGHVPWNLSPAYARHTNTSRKEIALGLAESYAWDHRPQLRPPLNMKIIRMSFYYIAFLDWHSFIGSFEKYFDNFKPVNAESKDSLWTLKKAV